MTTVAPVCHVPVDEVITQPSGPDFPNIPIAVDLPSAYAAINAMRQIVHQIANIQQPQAAKGGGGAHMKPSKKQNKTGPKPRYQELKPRRITREIIVHSSQDPSTYMKVKRIDGVMWKDTKTGELIEWQR